MLAGSRVISIRVLCRPQTKQVLPLLLLLRPFHYFFRFLARGGFRETRAEHRPFVWIRTKCKAHYGLDARSEMATRASDEWRNSAHAHAFILEGIETVRHRGKNQKRVITRGHTAESAVVFRKEQRAAQLDL